MPFNHSSEIPLRGIFSLYDNFPKKILTSSHNSISSPNLLKSIIHISFLPLVDRNNETFGRYFMSRGRRKKSLMRRLNTALARGAIVTVSWVQTVVVIAKKEWKVNDLARFSQQLKILLKKRGFEFWDDMEHLLENYWHRVVC